MSRRRTEVLRYARTLGYEHRGKTGGQHLRLWHPKAGTVFVASTPGASSLPNIRAMLRRLASRLRQEQS